MPSLRLLVGPLLLLLTSTAFACIQGHHLPRVRPAFDTLISLPAVVPEKLNFSAPPLEPLRLQLAQEKTQSLPTVSESDARVVYTKLVAAFEAKPPGTATAEETIDYAASLIFLGRPPDAIPVLLTLEKKQPGLYATAANLGTAYELAGELADALTWIREAIARNAASHAGTEWLHVAILETKLRLQRDSTWLVHHSVLDAAPAHSKEDILHAIEYQLNERLRFVTPIDAVVSDLFYQAALRLPTDDTERRNVFFDQSLRFDALRATQIAAERAPVRS